MRILSTIIALPIFWNVLFPQMVLASEVQSVDKEGDSQLVIIETRISLDKEEQIERKVETVMSPEEQEREKRLAKWKAKQGKGNLPKGKFTINASAYTAAADECGKSDGITASGVKVKEERTLACPPEFPFGTKIKIEGVGVRVCEDRGGAIKGNHIDIYVVTKKEAFAFGRRNLEAEVVES